MKYAVEMGSGAMILMGRINSLLSLDTTRGVA
jgi:hypothetical protein